MNLLLVVIVAACIIFGRLEAQSTQLTADNFDELINAHEFVLVNFYTDWCGFSRMLAPIYEEAAQKLKQNFPESGKVLLGKVNGDSAPGITARYKVTKYPTLKIFRYGAVSRREYRGQRSVDAIVGYVHDMLLKTIVHKLDSVSAVDSLDLSKKHIIGYIPQETSSDAVTLTRVAAQLHDDCQFNVLTGDQATNDGQGDISRLVFRQLENQRDGNTQHGPFPDHTKLVEWATSLCQPIVRELTFENAEEMTEAGLPFFILFYKSGDDEILTRYRNFIAQELMSARELVVFLTADGSKFTHPLNHLGKSLNDLPLIVIDSFQHMYIWRHDVTNDLEKPGLLKQFIDDLYSQKLHREFHQGPDPGQAAVQQIAGGQGQGQPGQVHLDVQHQVLVAPDGTKVQVLRVVQHDQPHGDVKPALDQAAQQVEQQKDEEDKQGTPPDNEQHIKREGDSAPGEGGVAVEQEQVIRVTVDKVKSSEEIMDENEVRAPQAEERSPPESVFKKLLPSPQRYSITRRDEL